MSTFADLEREVKQLRHRVRQLEGNPEAENEAIVSELVSNDDVDGERQAGRRSGGGFAAVAAEACEKARLSGESTRAILRRQTGRDNG